MKCFSQIKNINIWKMTSSKAQIENSLVFDSSEDGTYVWLALTNRKLFAVGWFGSKEKAMAFAPKVFGGKPFEPTSEYPPFSPMQPMFAMLFDKEGEGVLVKGKPVELTFQNYCTYFYLEAPPEDAKPTNLKDFKLPCYEEKLEFTLPGNI